MILIGVHNIIGAGCDCARCFFRLDSFPLRCDKIMRTLNVSELRFSFRREVDVKNLLCYFSQFYVYGSVNS